MSYHGWSLRRAESDIRELHDKSYIETIPQRATLSRYLNKSEMEKLLERLIILSALPLASLSKTLLIDSTWYQKFMNVCFGHKQAIRKVQLASHYKTRKLHIAMFKETRIVCWARATGGHVHDSTLFEDMLNEINEEGFLIDVLIADKGYVSKKAYLLCQELNIKNCFIQMKEFYTGKRPKSDLWRKQLKLFKDHPEEWHEVYRHRVIIEGLFSSWKRKNKNYIRNRISTSQNCELLLIAFTHNLTILGHHFL